MEWSISTYEKFNKLVTNTIWITKDTFFRKLKKLLKVFALYSITRKLDCAIAGMRDKLIHDYFGVDLDAVWDTVEKDIPPLKNEIKKLIEKEESYEYKK